MTQGQFTQFRGQAIFGGASYKISYSYQDQQYELSGFFDAIQTQETQLDKHVSMVVKKELEQQILLIPEVPIQLEQFELTFYHNNSIWFAHKPYQKAAKQQVNSSQKPSITYFCNGFQSWTTSREWELEDYIGLLQRLSCAYRYNKVVQISIS